jgi:peroxiredoxin Q/BCP
MHKGDVIEDFQSTDQHGQRLHLSELVSRGPLVLFFYPKAMTPG